MMWLKRKLKNWVDDAYDADESVVGIKMGMDRNICEDHSRPEDIENYTLTVWRATGGRCIQYKRYDKRHDKLHTELYVVSDEADLGDAVTNIVVQQALQQR
jgi:hypothetical protein